MGKMLKDAEIKSMASYVTFRQLYDDGKNDIYYIIARFAENVLATQKWYSFGLTELVEQMRSEFGFDIPDYVIKTSLKRLKYLERKEGKYYIASKNTNKECGVVSETQKSALENNQKLIDALIKYIEEKRS